MINTIIVLIAVDAVAMAISEGEPEIGAADDAESLHESEAVAFSFHHLQSPFHQSHWFKLKQNSDSQFEVVNCSIMFLKECE